MRLLDWVRFSDALCLLGIDTQGNLNHFIINPGLITQIRTAYKQDGAHITIASQDRYVNVRTDPKTAEKFLRTYLDCQTREMALPTEPRLKSTP